MTNDQKSRRETERYKEFSDCIRQEGVRQKAEDAQSKDEKESNRDLRALYDISPETEGLRQARDIRDELSMIEKVLEEQVCTVRELKFTNLSYHFNYNYSRLEKLNMQAQDVVKRASVPASLHNESS